MVTTSPTVNPWAVAVMMVGLPRVTPLMVLADPEPVASERTEPCEEMAVEVMDISRKLTKKATRRWQLQKEGNTRHQRAQIE
jgi:hypothetical protein